MVIEPKNNVLALVAADDEVDVCGQFPFAHSVQVDFLLRRRDAGVKNIGHDASRPRDGGRRNARIKIRGESPAMLENEGRTKEDH